MKRKGWWMAGVAAVSLLLGGAPRGPSMARAQSGTTHVLIVTGIPGEPRFAEAFARQARTLAQSLVERHGVPREHVVILSADQAGEAGNSGRATKAGISKALAKIDLEAAPDDNVMLVLIGHGSGTGADSRINISGPDLTAGELARALEPLAPRTIAIVNAASASGDFARTLAGDKRIVITSTASSHERNETIFGEHFVAAFAGGAADADKDGRLSLLEAYRYAQREVQRVYERDNRLLTEHARLEDDGDGRGTATPGEQGDGALARRFAFGGSAVAARASGDTVLASLLRRRADLEKQIEALRARKDQMTADAYEQELEALLVRLAEVSKAAREREERP